MLTRRNGIFFPLAAALVGLAVSAAPQTSLAGAREMCVRSRNVHQGELKVRRCIQTDTLRALTAPICEPWSDFVFGTWDASPGDPFSGSVYADFSVSPNFEATGGTVGAEFGLSISGEGGLPASGLYEQVLTYEESVECISPTSLVFATSGALPTRAILRQNGIDLAALDISVEDGAVLSMNSPGSYSFVIEFTRLVEFTPHRSPDGPRVVVASADVLVVPGGSCPADLNGDQLVEDADFVAFAAAYDLLDCADPSMTPGCPADLNNDGLVEDADFVLFAQAYDLLEC